MIGERNLAPERGPNVWDRDELNEELASRRRWLTGLGGVALAVAGSAMAAVGGKMVYRATRAAHGPDVPSPVGLDPLPQQASRLEDVVATDSAHSFPASDPPSWTPTMGTARPRKR